MKIHPAYNKTVLTHRYYQEKSPEKNYDKDQSRKQFHQDKNIDEAVLLKVLKKIESEQKEFLKSNPIKLK